MANIIVRSGQRGPTSPWTLGLFLSFTLAGGLNRPARADDPPKPAASVIESKKSAPITAQGSPDEQVVASINEMIRSQWTANKIKPSPFTTDYEFIRRASLDLIGRIAKPHEIDLFFKDPPVARRVRLIDRLLKSPEYGKNWANIWANWLLTRSGNSVYHEQMHGWLEEQFAQNRTYKDLVTDLLTATGKTDENGAVNFILAHLGEAVPAGKRAEEGHFEMVPITSRTTRLFLGLQTQCTQCHDHPFNPTWKQQHFWGVNAFFRQVDRKGNPLAMRNNARGMAAAVLELVDDTALNPDGVVFFEKRNGIVLPTKPVFLDGTKMPKEGATRRQELARLITGSEFFPQAVVNRMWAHFLGRGFTNPIDDFGEHNPPSHPELLDKLAKEFVHYGYDLKRLTRWICLSEAYHLSSQANPTNEKADAEPFFGRMLLKAMSPEQLFDSLMTATQAEAAENKEGKKKLREEWMKNLIVNFGDDEGNEVTFNGTVVQALMMMNGKEINDAITGKDKGALAVALKKGSPSATMNYLFLAALNRPAKPNEQSKILAAMRGVKDKDYKAPWQDLFWALLNSNEFLLNH